MVPSRSITKRLGKPLTPYRLKTTLTLAEQDLRSLDRLVPGRHDLSLDDATARLRIRRLVGPGFGDADDKSE
jgi:hypothetical protein